MHRRAGYGQDGRDGADGRDGSDGADGVGVVDSHVDYQVHSNGTNPPSGNWLGDVPEVPQGSYLWARTITEYSNGENITTYAVSYNATDGQNGTDGRDGNDGQDGQDGVGVTNHRVEYAQTASGSTIPASGWSSTRPNPSKGMYLWTRVTIDYSNNTQSVAYSTSYYGVDGTDGTDGKDGERGADGTDGTDGRDGISVDSIDEEYYHSNSATSLTGGVWTTTRPAWNKNKYIWIRTVTTFSNGETQRTDPISLQGYHGADGADGADGSDGADGADGLPNYTWIKYSLIKNPTAQDMRDTPEGMIYRGVAYNKRTATESNNPNDYTWEAMYDIEKLEQMEDEIDDFRLMITIQDTRNANYAPSHYRDNFADYEVTERKVNDVIGVPSENTHGITVTSVVDNQVEMVFRSAGETFTRVGDATTDIWGEWSQSETVEGAQEKASQSFGDSTEYAVELVGDLESRAKSYVDGLVNPLAEGLELVDGKYIDLDAKLDASNAEWRQTFSVSGGVNEIRNSVGYAELEFWTGTGNITTVQNAELESYGSGSAFILGANSRLEQNVIAPVGDKVFSILVQKDLNSTGYIEIEHDDGTELISLNRGNEMSYDLIELPFNLGGTNYDLRIVTDAGSEILVTNIMVNQGEERQGWSFAHDELYGSTFRMNRNGFRVYQLDGTQYTAMTPDEFAGYAIVGGVWQRTFALNGDTTQMRKAYVEEEMRIGGISMIRVQSGSVRGVAFVRSGN